MQQGRWQVVVSFKTELLSEYACHAGQKYYTLTGIKDFCLPSRLHMDNAICINTAEFKQAQQAIEKNWEANVRQLMRTSQKTAKAFLAAAKKIPTSLTTATREELAALFSTVYDKYERAVGLIGFVTIMDAVTENKLQQYYQEEQVKLPFAQFLQQIGVPSKRCTSSIAHEKLLTLTTSSTTEEIAAFCTTYGWINCTLFLGEPLTPKTLKEELAIKTHSEEESKAFIRRTQSQNIEASKLIATLPRPFADACRTYQELVYFRTARLEWFNEGCFFCRPLLTEIAKRLKLRFDEVIYLLPEEVITGLKEKKTPANIHQRQEKYALVTENYQTKLYVGEEAEAFRIKSKKTRTVTGIVACKGKAHGPACIVKDRSQLHKVKKGDILITPLTTPDFTTAMKKAAGIVTDLGSITSHAAIVSRELGKPCIVGTGHATSSFKEGDLIEIDTTTGVVHKKNA